MFYYIGIEEAKRGESLVYAMSETKISNYKEYFEGNACEFKGTNLPHNPYFDKDLGTIRALSLTEEIEKGIVNLPEGHALIDNKLVVYNPNYEEVSDGKIVQDLKKKAAFENALLVIKKKGSLRDLKEDLELGFIAKDEYDKKLTEIKNMTIEDLGGNNE